jgi:hypothetical protein
MGVIWDIIKDIPTAAALKERISDFESKLASLETENDLLKIDLEKANGQIRQLKSENEKLNNQLNPSEPAIHEMAQRILDVFAQTNNAPVFKEYVFEAIGGDRTITSYYFDDLKNNRYIESTGFTRGRPVPYRLTQKGKKYVIEHSLHSE